MALSVLLLAVASVAEAQWTGFDPDTPPEPGQRGVVCSALGMGCKIL